MGSIKRGYLAGRPTPSIRIVAAAPDPRPPSISPARPSETCSPPTICGSSLLRLVKRKLKKIQYRPHLINGCLAATGLRIEPS